MLNIFRPVRGFLTLDNVWIDNNVFRLHYKVTVIIFFTASLVVTSRQYIGDPIDCVFEGMPLRLLDTYCWIHSTFSIPSRWVGKQGHQIAYPGISPIADLADGTEVKYHTYYQWVCFVLFLQSAIFYFPRYLWKTAEGGKVRMLVQGLQEPILKPDAKENMIDNIVKYWKLHRGTHSLYALKFFFCEFLNFANVISQIYFIDFFLGGEFLTYGRDVLAYSEMEPEDRPDPMAKVFPKLTKCTFYKYGFSGTVEKKDGLCVLPLNIINEKIYILVWFWLIGLAAITGAFLLYRIAVICTSQLRVALILAMGGKSVNRSDVETILEPASLSKMQKLGDWLLLHFIVKNVDLLTVNMIIIKLYKDAESSLMEKKDLLKLNKKSSQV